MGVAIEQNEKFACVAFSGFNIILEQVPDPAELGLGCWTSSRVPFELDPWWRQQLGNVVCEHLEQRCNFVLLAKQQTSSDDPFSEESQILRNRVMFLMWGIAVAAGVSTFTFARVFGTATPMNRVEKNFSVRFFWNHSVEISRDTSLP